MKVHKFHGNLDTILCLSQVGLDRAEDSATRAKLYSQMVDLADFILTGYQPHLRSLLPISQESHSALLRAYERDRYNLIQPLGKCYLLDLTAFDFT